MTFGSLQNTPPTYILRIHFQGTAFIAFSSHERAELEWLAAVLNVVKVEVILHKPLIHLVKTWSKQQKIRSQL